MYRNLTKLLLAAMFCLWAAAPVNSKGPAPKPADTILQILTPKRVFVTQNGFDGDLGGLDGADEKCQAAADAVGLGGVWQAWLSVLNSSPTLRWDTHAQAHYYLLDGHVIAANYADLVDGELATPINITENGTPLVTFAWTGTASDGTPSGVDCNSWTTLGGFGTGGDTNTVDVTWTIGTEVQCDTPARLYCFEQ